MRYNLKHGLSNSPEYRAFQMAQDRCTNTKSQRWKSHGGRGIKFLFPSFDIFYAYVGPRPSPEHSLERMDNNGHYEVGNVKWATRSEQQLNKRSYTTWKRHGKGYSWHKLSEKWMVRVKYMGKTLYGGLFSDEKDAAKKASDLLAQIKETHVIYC